jgi:membrane peptidoglycan carboxypeptidase
MNRMMRTVMVSGTGVRAAPPGYDLAGKTGTTSDYKDAWFCGYTGGFAACAWMGRDDAQPDQRRHRARRAVAGVHDALAEEAAAHGDPDRPSGRHSAAAAAADARRRGRPARARTDPHSAGLN